MDVRGRIGARYEDWLAAQRPGEAPGTPLEGHSGYFRQPGPALDPRLFADGSERLKPAVRQTILDQLYDFWSGRYVDPESWSKVWIAGSAISYQWQADRGGVGDLDVLIGVDMVRFRAKNPAFRGLPEPLVARHFNKQLHDELWPQAAEYSFQAGEDPFEITYYVNPGAADIRDINPYAAYDVTDDEWTVRPPDLPEDWDPFTYFSQDWWEAATSKISEGEALVNEYRQVAADVGELVPGSPAWRNATARLSSVTKGAVGFFEEIHSGRRGAFGPGGKGYFGEQNVLWQYGKRQGVIDALRKIKGAHSQATRAAQEALYGEATLGLEENVLRASLRGYRAKKGGQ